MPEPLNTAAPALLAFELMALATPSARQGLAVRALADASAARLMIAGMTGACTGTRYDNAELAYWMSAILSSYYAGNGEDAPWADIRVGLASAKIGSAHSIRGALATVDETAQALRDAAEEMKKRLGGYCIVEYGYCDLKGKGPGIESWAATHEEALLGRGAASETLATTLLVFTDQRMALKNAKAEAAQGQASLPTPSAIIAAAMAEADDGDFDSE